MRRRNNGIGKVKKGEKMKVMTSLKSPTADDSYLSQEETGREKNGWMCECVFVWRLQ